MTIRSVCQCTLEKISGETLCELLPSLEQIHAEKMDYLITDVFLSFITEHCPSAAVSNCYHKLAKCLAAGYPFALLKWQDVEYKQKFTDMVLKTIRSIKCQDIDKIVEQWGEFFEEQEQYYRNFIFQKKD